MKPSKIAVWGLVFGIGGLIVQPYSYAELNSVSVRSTFGDEDLKGVKTRVLEIRYSEVWVREQRYVWADIVKNRDQYLKLGAPVLVDFKGEPYPFRFVGREVKQLATNNRLASELIFKYKHPTLQEWSVKDPILVQFDDKIFRTRPVTEETGQKSEDRGQKPEVSRS